MYGNSGKNPSKSRAYSDKPQHLMYGNGGPEWLVERYKADKPQHLMYGNFGRVCFPDF